MNKYTKVIIISVIIILFIYQTVSLNQIKRELDSLSSENNNMRQELLGLVDGISQNIQSTIYEEIGRSHITKDVNFTFKSNIDGGHNIDARIELAKLSDNPKVLFMYKSESENNWKEIELEKINELSYIGNIDLPYGKQYEYKVVISGKDSESSEINYIDKSEFIPMEPDISWGYGESEIYLSAYDSYYHGNNEVKINDIEMIVGYQGKEKNYKCRYSSGSTTENGDISISDSYEVRIQKNDFNNKFDYIKMKITYANGVVDVVDITSQLWELSGQLEGDNNDN